MSEHRKKHVLKSLLILMLLSTGYALADDGNNTATSVSIEPGPFERERISLMTKIQEAKGRGIGIQPYMAAFQNLEGMVKNGASPETVRTKLSSLKTALEQQRLGLIPVSDLGIIGLKFIIRGEKLPEVGTVFAEGPAALAQLKTQDIITQIDGHPTSGLNTEVIRRMLVGEANTKVTLTIQRGDATFVKTLTRMHARDFAKRHPAVWKEYLSTM